MPCAGASFFNALPLNSPIPHGILLMCPHTPRETLFNLPPMRQGFLARAIHSFLHVEGLCARPGVAVCAGSFLLTYPAVPVPAKNFPSTILPWRVFPFASIATVSIPAAWLQSASHRVQTVLSSSWH